MLKSKAFFSLTIFFIIMIGPSFVSAQEKSAEAENTEIVTDSAKDSADKAVTLKNIVVTATRTEIDRRQTGTSLTVITEDDIKKSGKTTIAEVLTGVPGVTVNRTSVFGGETSVYIRGADTGNVLVMIDGVEVNDPSYMNRAFDFSNLMLENIERIEILRGAQSTLYGSDATGGVINIITKKGSGDSRLSILAEAGSYLTFREALNISGGTEKTYYSFSASHLGTNGISKVSISPDPDRSPDDDKYKNITISSRLGVNLLKNSSLDFNFRFIDIDAELDDASIDDPNYKSYSKFFSSGAKFKQPIMEWWDHNISLSYINQLRRYRDREDDFDPTTYNEWFEGTNKKAAWQHNFYITRLNTLTCGAEVQEEKASSLYYDDYGTGPAGSYLDEQKVQTFSYYLQNHLKLLDRIFIVLGGRIDDHKEFGYHGSYRGSGSFIMPVTETRLTCNYGTGFKAPSIYQLYDASCGNKNLEPEESRSFDAGFEQKLLDDIISFEAAYFINTYKNMLNFGSASRYENIGEASMKGIEGEVSVQPLEYLKIKYVHTYQITENKETGKELYKRPKNQGSLIVNLFLFDRLNINFNADYKGKRKDISYDPITYASTEKTLLSYLKFDIFISYDILDNLQIFGRVENIMDKEYQEAYGYEMPGRSFYGGAKAVF